MHLENVRQNEIIIPKWFFLEEQKPNKEKIERVNNTKSLKQIARENIKLDDKNLDKGLAEEVNTPYYFTDKTFKIGFKINLGSHNFIHANFFVTVIPICPDFGTETSYNNKILEETVVFYARLLSQYKFNYHLVLSARFYKITEEDQRKDEIEFFINLNFDHKLTENDNNNIEVKSDLKHQIQIQETNDSGWLFDKIISMKIGFYKTGELSGSSYAKIPQRSNTILNVEKINKYCFSWSILAGLHPCKKDHLNRVSNYRRFFNEINTQYFEFTIGFKCSDVHKFENLNYFSLIIFELKFYQ